MDIEDRAVSMGDGLASIPERLLLDHARGHVLFLCGAGVSMPALPSFRKLVLDVYKTVDSDTHFVMAGIPENACNHWMPEAKGLNTKQLAEVRRFIQGDYDVVLGMLERRMDERYGQTSKVRAAVAERLNRPTAKPSPLHIALMKLAERGGARTIVTTNFDLLLQKASSRLGGRVETYTLGTVPRPSLHAEFSGVLHIHGALPSKAGRTSELILTDRDFGEVYLRRRTVPDFIYDAARIFKIVLVGYSANDAPMRYLLNAVAADGLRFPDLKERFTFVPRNTHDSVALEDWKARGITPIPYDSDNGHIALRNTLERWAELSPHICTDKTISSEFRRIARVSRVEASEGDRDIFDHIFRRSDSRQRVHFAAIASKLGAHISWLDAIRDVCAETRKEHQA